MNVIRKADSRLVSNMDEQKTRWTEYIEKLFLSGSSRRQLQSVDIDSLIDKAPPSLGEVKETVAKLKDGKTDSVRNITAAVLEAEGEALIHGSHADLTADW